MKTNPIKTYSELLQYSTYEDRVRYLMTHSNVSDLTFAGSRYLNQRFYTSLEWRRFRRHILIRDDGCDLALPDHPIPSGVHVVLHHIMPVTKEDLLVGAESLMDPENVVCVTDYTHRLIHYSNDVSDPNIFSERLPNDTVPWR